MTWRWRATVGCLPSSQTSPELFPAASKPLLPLPGQPGGVPYPTVEWPIGEPTDADVERLNRELDRAFANDDPNGLGLSLAFVAVQGGRIVAERYGPETDVDTTLISWSMAKSVTQALLGVQIRRGLLSSTDIPAPVPEWSAPDDPRASITVDQLVKMRSGLAWTEEYTAADNDHDGTGEVPLSDVLEMLFGRGHADMANFAADMAAAHPAGEEFLYSSGTSNILARLVGDVACGHGTGLTGAERTDRTRRFMFDALFDPLGMASAAPRFDDAGTFIGSSYLYATARDFARFGLLYLRDGVWDGTRLLPEGWVDAARTPHAQGEDSLEMYGDHWWIYPCRWGSFRASGYEGQAIVVVPGLDLVLVRLGKTPYENGNDSLLLHLAEVISAFAET